jgi:hypothetical protein
MPRAQRFHLAQKLAVVALGAATLAIGTGQLPALAYGGPPPPPPAPGGYTAVVTSQTVGPGGAVIGPVGVGKCSVALTVRPGTFKSQVQITLTAPTVQGIGDGGQPGYRAVCGVGVLIQVNGKLYTGNFGRSLTLDISGFSIRHGARVVVWNGKEFVPVHATIAGPTVRISFTGSNENFAVLMPAGGGRSGSPGAGVTAVSRGTHMAGAVVLTSLFLAPADPSPAGIGVLAPELLGEISR